MNAQVQNSYVANLRKYHKAIFLLQQELLKVESGEVWSAGALEMYVEWSDRELYILRDLRELMHLTGGYEFQDEIPFFGGKLERGRIEGTLGLMVPKAKEWVCDFPKEHQDCTYYELGTYLLYASSQK